LNVDVKCSQHIPSSKGNVHSFEIHTRQKGESEEKQNRKKLSIQKNDSKTNKKKERKETKIKYEKY